MDSSSGGGSKQVRTTDVIIEETGPSTDNEVRTTAVFVDQGEMPASSSDAATHTNNGGEGGNENSNAAANQLNLSTNLNGNYAAHVQTESVLSSNAYDRSERFMSKDSAG